MTRRQGNLLAGWLLWLLAWLLFFSFDDDEYIPSGAWAEAMRTLKALPVAAALATVSGLLFLGGKILWNRWRPDDPPSG